MNLFMFLSLFIFMVGIVACFHEYDLLGIRKRMDKKEEGR